MSYNIFNSFISEIRELSHHAYIIETNKGIDRHYLAKEILKGIVDSQDHNIIRKIHNENFLDVVYISGDEGRSNTKKRSIRSEHITSIYEFLKFSPLENEHRYVFIEEGENATVEAFNKLLKTLEEPPLGSKIFILVDNREMLLETIKSRCVIKKLPEVQEFMTSAESQIREIGAELFLSIINKRELYYIFNVLEKIGNNRKMGLEIIDFLESSFYELLKNKNTMDSTLTKKQIFRAVSFCEDARRQILSNIVLNYGLKNLVIKIRR